MGARHQFQVAVVGLGGIGSSALYWSAKRVGHEALGLERFEFGHERGASQDHSRIIRLTYHRADYVRFAQRAFASWVDVEKESGATLVTRTGGIHLFPPGTEEQLPPFTAAMEEVGVNYEIMLADQATRRWPQWRMPRDTVVLYQADSGVVAAARANVAHRQLAARLGATLLDQARVHTVRRAGDSYEITTERGTHIAERLIITTDAWINDVLPQLWQPIPVAVSQEQVAYYDAQDPALFRPERFPVWIWTNAASFYGVPEIDGTGVKVGWSGAGPKVSADSRTFQPDPAYSATLDQFMREHLPLGHGGQVRVKTCLYTRTPDRDFVLDLVPGHPRVAVGLGAAHGFKFASVFGRSLVELVFDGTTRADTKGWTIQRRALLPAGGSHLSPHASDPR